MTKRKKFKDEDEFSDEVEEVEDEEDEEDEAEELEDDDNEEEAVRKTRKKIEQKAFSTAHVIPGEEKQETPLWQPYLRAPYFGVVNTSTKEFLGSNAAEEATFIILSRILSLVEEVSVNIR